MAQKTKKQIDISEYSDYSSAITIDGKKYDLLLTVEALKLITDKYGGLENLSENISAGANQIEDIMWLIATLTNQVIERHNIKNPDETNELLTPKFVGLFSLPYEIQEFTPAIFSAIAKGMKRAVKSEEDQKNVKATA